METVYIDGAFGEGGGQIIRTSVALAALTGKAMEMRQIRARRSKPGLQAQHLTSVQAAAALCEATLAGAELGSQFLRFVPGKPVNREAFAFDVAAARHGASAGATGLVAQTILIPTACLATSERVALTIQGGTHVPMAPTTDYLLAVYAPLLRRMGMGLQGETTRAGFYPKGGGEVKLAVRRDRPCDPIEAIERGRLKKLSVWITTAQLPDHVALRGQEAVQKPLKGYGVPVTWELRRLESPGAGAAVLVAAECEQGGGGWVSLGERGKPMERVAEEAVRGFQSWFASGAGVDEHLADQLVLPCALLPQTSRWTTPLVTDHLRTVLHTVQQFLPITFTLTERADGFGEVTLTGTPNIEASPN